MMMVTIFFSDVNEDERVDPADSDFDEEDLWEMMTGHSPLGEEWKKGLRVAGTVEVVRQGHDVTGFFVLLTIGIHLGRFP